MTRKTSPTSILLSHWFLNSESMASCAITFKGLFQIFFNLQWCNPLWNKKVIAPGCDLIKGDVQSGSTQKPCDMSELSCFLFPEISRRFLGALQKFLFDQWIFCTHSGKMGSNSWRGIRSGKLNSAWVGSFQKFANLYHRYKHKPGTTN